MRRTGDVWFSNSVGILELFTGLISALILLPLAKNAPWVLSIFPIMLTVRGANNGIFSGVLTTSLYLGTIEPKFRKNSDYYYSLIVGVYNLSLINTFIAIVILAIFLANPLLILLGYLIMVTTSIIAVSFSIIATSFVGFTAFKSGMNPDNVVYPVMSTINDIMISLFLGATLYILRPWEPEVTITIGVPILLMVLLFNYLLHRRYREHEIYRKVVSEGQFGILFAVILSSISGIFMAESYEFFVENPALLMILPFLMTSLGDAGSVMASRLTTSLHMGEVDYRIFSDVLRSTIDNLLLVAPPFLTITMIITIISTLLLSSPIFIIKTLTIAFALAYATLFLEIPIVIFISTQTFKFGLNPDNFAIPIITSSADFMSIILMHVFSALL